MDWVSFSVGFLAFPVIAVAALGAYFGFARLIERGGHLPKLAVDQRSSTLGFSPRLIGEIGVDDLQGDLQDDLADSEPAAKAS